MVPISHRPPRMDRCVACDEVLVSTFLTANGLVTSVGYEVVTMHSGSAASVLDADANYGGIQKDAMPQCLVQGGPPTPLVVHLGNERKIVFHRILS